MSEFEKLTVLFHPSMVHFPVALYFLELILIGFWFVRRDAAYIRFARFSFVIGFIFMIVSLGSGWLAAGGWENITGITRKHFFGAMTVLGIYSIRGIWWFQLRKDLSRLPLLFLIFTVLAYAAVIFTAREGGEMVYGLS